MDAAFDALYAELPTIECRGQCADSCTTIAMTRPESDRIVRAGGPRLPHDPPARPSFLPCPALSQFNTCTVYRLRPLVCRIWGMTEYMACPAGCRPAGGFLTDKQAHEFFARGYEIAGDFETAEMFREPFRSADSERRWRQVKDQLLVQEVNRRQERMAEAERDRTAIYVHGPGRVSSRPLPGRHT